MKTEKQKMLAGELYDPLDPELCQERQRCRDLCKLLNDSREEQQEERKGIIADLLGSPTDAWIQPPFFCDYGTNISLGAKVFFNFNCVVLDVMQVTIGSNVLFGPSVQCTQRLIRSTPSNDASGWSPQSRSPLDQTFGWAVVRSSALGSQSVIAPSLVQAAWLREIFPQTCLPRAIRAV